jgi:ribosomal protein L11 methylase PrmA
MIGAEPLPGSFRDPSGFVFSRHGVLYRQINSGFDEDIKLLVSSGLHKALTQACMVVDFEVVEISQAATSAAAMVIRPSIVKFLSYPFEWCFSQLKAAALLTLDLLTKSLENGMTLKDASAYNVQFIGASPIFIDTLSFTKYEEGEPWVAYKQFCQHFLAPLALMAKSDIRLGSLLRSNLDGIPLDLASKLLPFSTKASLGLMTHIHLHAKAEGRSSQSLPMNSAPRVSKAGVHALVDSLVTTINHLSWEPSGTEWGDYYLSTNYSSEAFADKESVVKSFLNMVPETAETCCDLGANNGEFSKLALDKGLDTVALDIDPAAVEKCYLQAKKSSSGALLPLLQDLRNPTPNYGWGGVERDSIVDRFSCDVVLALALVHHLAIGNNVPLALVADYFSKIGEWLIVEFVPKEDSQVQRMLGAREDIFSGYHLEGFENEFGNRFKIIAKQEIVGTSRIIYLMQRKV